MFDDEPVLRIYLRTFNSVVLIFQNNSSKIIIDEFRNNEIPSFIAFKNQEEILVVWL